MRSEAALVDALALGDDIRIAYYNARLSASRVRDEMIALVGAMAGVKDMRRRDAERAVASADAEFDGREVIERAVRHGVLTQTDEDRVLFGIPSFRRYMVEQRRDAKRERRT